MNSVNVIINGKPTKGSTDDYILDIAKREGIHIPTLCNDDRLEPFSSCYVCVVEIEGMPKPQPACSTKIREGMVIQTESKKIVKARQTALNLLLSNHYADCVAPCKETCPAGVDVQGYISLIEKGLYHQAIALIKQVNPLPAICGRVCVRPCEVACRRTLLDEEYGVGIDYLKRFAADVDLESDNKYKPKPAPSTGKKVAIIGAGPGGLSAAHFLQLKGHQCDIYEAAPNPGGWLRYGIPEYRLPNDILDKEVKNITDLGVNIYYNKKLGDNLKYKELNDNYDSTIICIGSQRGTLLGCDGEDADGVYSGIDYLRNMEMTGQRYDFKGKKVIVVGGGNTAMDCCRSALRCDSTDVKIVYRRTEKEMPANPIEIHESKLEGVEYLLLHNPVRVNKDENGKLKSVTLIKMELGEPDASGRRRPVPVEGSEFDLEVDYILAAIGQKTDINFLEDVNSVVKNGELKANKWGDIDADTKTLQTGVPNVFAAGDGVTGPATLIEAVAQAKIASHSCHQFLCGMELVPEKKVFISRKDNFKEQNADDYLGRYQKQMRQEMPVLEAEDRVNYKEVELGYENEEVALSETTRCLECGCSEFFDCKLQEYATKYDVNQKEYAGEFKDYEIDFSHPLIEIDNNKCILCSKCVRICTEVVGAKALGLVQRGFDTFVAPAMGNSLNDTNCESCGMCVSICPTGAITENTPFKIMPVEFESFQTIDPFNSEGASIELRHKAGFIFRTEGVSGLVNKKASIGKLAKFGYPIFNSKDRITKPMLKKNGKWQEISFKDAFTIIKEKFTAKPEDTMVFAGGRLSNEELYLAQKFTRAALKTNNIASLNSIGRGAGYTYNNIESVDLSQFKDAGKVYIFGSGLNYDQTLVNHMIFAAAFKYNTKVILITDNDNAEIAYKCNEIVKTKSYFAFVKAINKYILDNNLYNKFFIKGHVADFDKYSEELAKDNLDKLCKDAGLSIEFIANFAKEFNKEQNAITVFQEKEISGETSLELLNLNFLTGKLGKTGSGILALKELCNSQGLTDMGVRPTLIPGAVKPDDDAFNKLGEIWGIDKLSNISECLCEKITGGKFKNFMILGEDPIGTAINPKEIRTWFKSSEFMVVSDYFITETAEIADMILPASFGFESGGTYTNTMKYIQRFEKELNPKTGLSLVEQLAELCKVFDIKQSADVNEILDEIMQLLSESPVQELKFNYCNKEESVRYFLYACDSVMKRVYKRFDF
jgi:formate dehydrogenase major subunit